MPNAHRALRHSIAGLVLAALTAQLAGCAVHHTGNSRAKVLTSEGQRVLSPSQVVSDLKAGNERFAAGKGTSRDYVTQVRQTANGQYPKAVVLSCLDSRIPPEIIFDQGIGDIFVARVAGNFENTDILGSMEYATAAAGARAIVVLGHNHCGAVKGAVDDVRLGNLTATLENVKPSVESVRTTMPGPHTSKDEAFVQAVAVENVRRTMQEIASRSSVIAERIDKGQLVIVGGMYDLSTGQVAWLDR